MKSLFSTLIAILFLTASCEKDNTDLNDLTGNWVVKKMLIDPGNGSAVYQDVPGNPYVVFHKDGSATSSYAAFGLHMLRSYQIADSARVVMSFSEESSHPSTPYRYKFSGDTLVLNPPCFEGCGLKLIRSN